MTDRRVVLILASIDDRATVAASLARFREELGDRGEVLLVDASADDTADEAERMVPGLRVLRMPIGRLVPELWRDGLDATETPLVAFSTAKVSPRPGWLTALLEELDRTDAAVVAGPIAPAPALNSTDQAAYLLRYVNYHPPIPDANRSEPPGENALYRRDRLSGLESAWSSGFWEVEINQLLRARGEGQSMSDRAVVEFLGTYPLFRLLRSRFAHSRRYGATRAEGRAWAARIARTAAWPIVPFAMTVRIIREAERRGLPPPNWFVVLPKLFLLLIGWALGEAVGTCLGRARGPVGRRRESASSVSSLDAAVSARKV